MEKHISLSMCVACTVIARLSMQEVFMHVICDGTCFGEGINGNTICPYEQEPHKIHTSDTKEGKRLIIYEQPDWDRPIKYASKGREWTTATTIKVCTLEQDVHTSKGEASMTVAEDGSITRVHNVAVSRYEQGVDYLIERLRA